ncbi:MAG TPA: response regulator transcription factor [Candidatus Acidoferrales bacterium]|nr:response regulator transcription factor [Candidatus Acidoferrales bacterium]
MMNALKVLLVDDDPLVRRALRTTLTSAGYAVVEAWTGEDALEKISAESADVILLDLKMPGMGGLEACRRIREVADTPIMVISILRTEEFRVQASDAGADDYLVKPFGIQDLVSRIQALRRRVAGLESTLSTGSLSVKNLL